MECEGHAIIKTGGYYFWLMSWCTGWDFNDNHYFYSTKLAGPWTAGGKIATANTHTYESQVGFAVTVKGSNKTTFFTPVTAGQLTTTACRIVLLPIEVSGTNFRSNGMTSTISMRKLVSGLQEQDTSRMESIQLQQSIREWF